MDPADTWQSVPEEVCGQNGNTCVVNLDILMAAASWPAALGFRNYPT